MRDDIHDEEAYYCGNLLSSVLKPRSAWASGVNVMDMKIADDLDGTEEAMRTMLLQLLNPLIDCPELCSVIVSRRNDSTAFLIQIEAGDLERLTGAGSRTAKSLQLIASAIGMRSQRRFSLVFGGESGSSANSAAELPVITHT